jgi:hypothetical protein
MAVIWVETPEESGNVVQRLRTSHIPVERLREVAHDAFLNDLETQHIYYCRQCLNWFGDLLRSDDLNLLPARSKVKGCRRPT